VSTNKQKPEERVNPLFRNTTKAVPPAAPIQEATPVPKTEPVQARPTQDEELPSAGVRHRRVGKIPFKEAYKQFTSFLDVELDRRFHALLAEETVTKTELFNEAIADLLKKYGK
jgi:hypothetical protein